MPLSHRLGVCYCHVIRETIKLSRINKTGKLDPHVATCPMTQVQRPCISNAKPIPILLRQRAVNITSRARITITTLCGLYQSVDNDALQNVPAMQFTLTSLLVCCFDLRDLTRKPLPAKQGDHPNQDSNHELSGGSQNLQKTISKKRLILVMP